MQLDQILIRPIQDKYILQYSDAAGRCNSLVLTASTNAAAATVIADAQQRVPEEKDRPDKARIEQEIATLESRVKLLKESIGEVVP